MKMKSMSSLFCAVAILGTASVAMAGAYGEAEQAEEMPRSAPAVAEVAQTEEFSPFPYVQAGGLYAKEFFEDDAHQINRTWGWGYNVKIGYRFAEMIAAELLFEHVVEFDADSGLNIEPKKFNNIDRAAWTLMPQVKVFPIQGFAEPFISVGAGLMKGDNGKNNEINPFGPGTIRFGTVDEGYGFAMRFGAGADFYATENIFITPEVAYTLPLTSSIDNYDFLTVSLGIGYAFN